MTGIFTPTGDLTAVTLVDDASRLFGQVYALGGQAREQVTPLFRGANPARFMRGNVQGQCVFSAWRSFESVAAAAAHLYAQYGLLNLQGLLALTFDGTALNMPGATLRVVEREEWNGRFLRVRYEFGIGGFAAPETD